MLDGVDLGSTVTIDCGFFNIYTSDHGFIREFMRALVLAIGGGGMETPRDLGMFRVIIGVGDMFADGE